MVSKTELLGKAHYGVSQLLFIKLCIWVRGIEVMNIQ